MEPSGEDRTAIEEFICEKMTFWTGIAVFVLKDGKVVNMCCPPSMSMVMCQLSTWNLRGTTVYMLSDKADWVGKLICP